MTDDAEDGSPKGRSQSPYTTMLAILGLMAAVFIRRRRVWVKVGSDPQAGTLMQVAGLSKTDAPGLADEVEGLARAAGEESP